MASIADHEVQIKFHEAEIKRLKREHEQMVIASLREFLKVHSISIVAEGCEGSEIRIENSDGREIWSGISFPD